MDLTSTLPSSLGERVLARLPLVIGLIVLAAAVAFIYSVFQTVSLSAVIQSFWALPSSKLLSALVLTAASYVALCTYDIMSFRWLGRAVSSRQVAAIAAVSYAFSQAVGFGTLTGGAIRYRLYSALNVPSVEIVQVTVLSALTFLLGVSAVGGLALLTKAAGLAQILSVSPVVVEGAGGAIILCMALYLAWRAAGPGGVAAFGFILPLPGVRVTLLQIVLGAADVSVSAAALWVLLPDNAVLSLPAFAGIYAALIATGIVLHIPGSVGVLEAGVVFAFPQSDHAQVLSAVLAYRVIYYILPFALGAFGLGLVELKPAFTRLSRTEILQRTLFNAAPPVVAALSFLCGVVLLLSGATPPLQFRMDLLQEFVPLPLVEASHLMGSLIGFVLLVLASGLYRRLDGAWLVTVSLLTAGIIVSLAKGLDYEEASVLAMVLAITALARPAFYRRSSLLNDRPSPLMLSLIMIAVAAMIWLTFLAYADVPYISDVWWQFAWDSHAPRSVRAVLTTSMLATIYLVWLQLRPSRRRLGSSEASLTAIQPVVATSPDPESNLALTGGKRFLLSDDHDAFIMYAVQGNSWIAMGDPVGNPAKYENLLWRYLELVDRFGGRPVFYQISRENVSLYLNLGLPPLKIGEEAIVDVAGFNLQGGARASLRHAMSRAKREAMTFEIVSKDSVPAILSELKFVSDAWLSAKRSQEKQFSIGHFSPDYLVQFDHAVVRQNGGIIAFANIWPSAGSAFSVDLMRHQPDAPNGLMDFLFCNIILWGKERGYKSFSLGMAPLSGLPNHRLAPTLHRAANLLVAHGESIYGFAGLRIYKEKFRPTWRPRYLAVANGFFVPAAVFDLTLLISRSFTSDLKEPERWASRAA